MRMLLDLVVETAGRQDGSWTGWNVSGKGYKGNGEISDRDPIPKWDFQGPGARLIETLVTRAQFLATRHQYSCEQTWC